MQSIEPWPYREQFWVSINSNRQANVCVLGVGGGYPDFSIPISIQVCSGSSLSSKKAKIEGWIYELLLSPCANPFILSKLFRRSCALAFFSFLTAIPLFIPHLPLSSSSYSLMSTKLTLPYTHTHTHTHSPNDTHIPHSPVLHFSFRRPSLQFRQCS